MFKLWASILTLFAHEIGRNVRMLPRKLTTPYLTFQYGSCRWSCSYHTGHPEGCWSHLAVHGWWPLTHAWWSRCSSLPTTSTLRAGTLPWSNSLKVRCRRSGTPWARVSYYNSARMICQRSISDFTIVSSSFKFLTIMKIVLACWRVVAIVFPDQYNLDAFETRMIGSF